MDMILSSDENTVLTDWELTLTIDHILRGQGADPEMVRARRPQLVDVAAWALTEGVPLLKPAVVMRWIEVTGVRHEKLLLADHYFLSSPLIIQHLAGASEVVVMVCTIGPQLEAISGELIYTNPVLGMALEGVGTAAVEALATQACSDLEKQVVGMGLKASIPLSPGMVGWEVNPGQHQLFALVDASLIGVSLNSSSMMVPRLSISQVVGIGTQMVLQGRTCDYCNLKDTCRYQDHYVHQQ